MVVVMSRRGFLLLLSGIAVASVAVAMPITDATQDNTGCSASPEPGSDGGADGPVGCRTPVVPNATAEPLRLPEVPWEGGPAYYRQWAATDAAGWDEPAFFPIGVWFESVHSSRDVELDKSAGLNTYFELVDGSDMGLIRDAGMFALPSKPIPGHGNETVGWLLTDEVDLWAHDGDAEWTGNFPGEGTICIPEDASCGYTVLKMLNDRLPQDGKPRYQNIGFHAMLYATTEGAANYLDYTAKGRDYSDLASADQYWYSDPGMCELAQIPGAKNCQKAGFYGWTLDKMHALDAHDGKREAVYAFVEVGSVFDQFDLTIAPHQIKAAVMNSLIHGARGIVYFNHNFGGSCISQHSLRECYPENRRAVSEINALISSLAPVLNSPSLRHTFSETLDTMLKYRDGSYYVFAMTGREAATGAHTMRLPAGLSAESADVVGENRSITISDGRYTDLFAAEHSYHIYKITPQTR